MVWGRKNSINVQRVMWTVAELGLTHEREDVGGPFGGLDTDDYGTLNPNRRIPTIAAWYERLQERAHFRTHVMIPLS